MKSTDKITAPSEGIKLTFRKVVTRNSLGRDGIDRRYLKYGWQLFRLIKSQQGNAMSHMVLVACVRSSFLYSSRLNCGKNEGILHMLIILIESVL